MIFRSFHLIFLSIIILVSVCNGFICPRITDSNNIDQCDMTKALIPLLQTNVYQPAKFLGTIKRTITYPQSIPDQKHVISCIKITNLDTSDHGGFPQILSGGVGSYDAQILITSQWSQPINFRIEIWAEV